MLVAYPGELAPTTAAAAAAAAAAVLPMARGRALCQASAGQALAGSDDVCWSRQTTSPAQAGEHPETVISTIA
jgi:hypothetical protein